MKFLALCPCDKIIFDKRDVPSLISIIQNIEIAFLSTIESQVAAATMPKNAGLPKEWAIYTRWESSDEDVGKTYEQFWQIYWPDGEKFAEHSLTLKPIVQGDHIQHSTINLFVLPAGQVGMVKISTWLTHEGRRASEIIETSIGIKHVPPPNTG
jgi:hypothetical protein